MYVLFALLIAHSHHGWTRPHNPHAVVTSDRPGHRDWSVSPPHFRPPSPASVLPDPTPAGGFVGTPHYPGL